VNWILESFSFLVERLIGLNEFHQDSSHRSCRVQHHRHLWTTKNPPSDDEDGLLKWSRWF